MVPGSVNGGTRTLLGLKYKKILKLWPTSVIWSSLPCWAERLQNRRGLEPFRKPTNESLHGRVPKSVEAEEIHLIHRLAGGPTLIRHAVRRHKNSRSVVAKSAVHKNFLLGVAPEQRKELRHLFVARGFPSAHRNVYEAQSQRFGLLAFPISYAVF